MQKDRKMSPSTLRLVVFALMGSHIMYVLVALIVTTKGTFDISSMSPVIDFKLTIINLLQYVLFGVTGLMILVANFIPGIIFRKLSASSSEDELAQTYAVSKIMQHVMLESIGIFGLVLILFSGSLVYAAFMGGALLLHILFFPWLSTSESIKKLIDR